jgi:hypothetical protein
MAAEHVAQVDHVENVEAQIAKIVVNRLGQVCGGEGRKP